jgi:hypothetical protein
MAGVEEVQEQFLPMAMDGRSGGSAGAIFCRWPWMAGVEEVQEQFSCRWPWMAGVEEGCRSNFLPVGGHRGRHRKFKHQVTDMFLRGT